MFDFYGCLFEGDTIIKFIGLDADDIEEASDIVEKYIRNNYTNRNITYAIEYQKDFEDVG